MSEHSPLPWKLDKGEDLDGNPQVWHVMDANGNRVITTDCGFYTRFEGDYDLIVNAVNSIDRLRKSEDLENALKGALEAITRHDEADYACEDEAGARGARDCRLILEQALQSSESDK